MREIKFRALKDDMSNYNFVYGYLITTPDGVPRITSDVGGLFHTCIKGTVGQYTGLKDKNGKDIYDGDILFNENGNLLVEFSDHYLGYFVGLNEGEFVETPLYDSIFPEVIGNIHENPEMLNKC